MKRPMSLIIITRDPQGAQETHHRFDALTSHPRWKLCTLFLRAFFTIR